MGRKLRFYINIHHSCTGGFLSGRGMKIDKTFDEDEDEKENCRRIMYDNVDKALDELFQGSCGTFGDIAAVKLPKEIGRKDGKPGHPGDKKGSQEKMENRKRR